ncbi:hypothetical protein Val02_72040 [Virgisporangium aliadipatigenens]|uniref:Uncharacterized protein n=1 Tax=Virgisporangium aliadipatigenens TaxID=741659 RepID=A0A8J3YV70_9ACTN|nr:hypothetical protein [Virgisporangium aliadipatigenens]GIJ50318.1 hypothetical protein Val02_72040 [Virgisporangium aliadipatigenens]
MSKVNRVDSLTAELRDIKRRLHALETALGAVAARAAQSTAAADNKEAAAADSNEAAAGEAEDADSAEDDEPERP